MGVKYSRGPLPAKIRKRMGNISMVKLRGLMAKFQRRRNKEISLMKRDELFMNREEVQWLFELTSMQTFEMFRLMDKEHKFRIGLWDMWGALILMCLDIDPDEKIDQIFALGDHNNDEWMTIADLKTLMVCVCRGLSRMKNIHTMTEGAIGKYIKSMLSMCHLKENGEISLRDVRNYMGVDENSRSYFAALGAKAAVVDTGMLVAQRREIMQEIAEVEKEIKEVMLKAKISQEDREAYEKERGGDIHVLHVAGHNADARAVEGEDEEEGDDEGWGEPTLEQRARRLQRAKEMGSNETQFLQDALIFSDPNYAKKNKSDGSSSFDEHAILRKWKSLTDSEDGLRELDIDLLEDLFEHAGITLTDLEAEECLDSIPRNALNMFNVHDVIGWYRDKMNTKPPIKGRPPLWRSTATEAVELIKQALEQPSKVVAVLNRQKDIIDAIEKKRRTVREMEEAMQAEQERLEEEARIKAGGKPVEDDGKDKKKGGAPPLQREDIVGELKGYVRLAAWHRQSLQTPDPNKAEFKLKFGNPDEVKEEPKEPGILDKLKKMTKKGGKLKGAKKAAVARGPAYKTVISLNYVLAQVPQGERPLFFDKATDTLKHRGGWNALALLDVFKNAPLAGDENATAPIPFGSVAWFGLTIGEGVDEKEEMVLSRAIENFFEAVPLEYRAGIYTQVQTKIFSLPLEEEEVDSDDDEGGGGGDGDQEEESGKKKHARMILVALLHETDYFVEFEESMPAGVAATRALRRAGVRLSLINSFSELYDASLPFESYMDRLFGPQEDELGDEGMNPLRFAKLQKARVKAAREGAKKVATMSPELVDEQLALRGLSILGQKRERKKRLKKALERQGEISGFGELSAFGADMSNALFSKFRVNKNFGDRMMRAEAKLKAKAEAEQKKGSANNKVDKNKRGGGMFAKIAAAKSSKAESKGAKDEEEEEQDTPGMTLWDFNNFLSHTGAPTLYDFREYKSAMAELGFLQDKNFGLTPEGLAAYYELYGGIGRDMKSTGIGSLSDALKGELLASCHYDASGLDGITALLERHAVMYPWLKYLLAFVSSVTDFEHEASYDSLADMLSFAKHEGLRSLRENACTPGWFSAFVHSCMEWLADGNDGVLVSLRRSVHEVFGRYSQYEELFPEIVAASAGDYAAARASPTGGAGGAAAETKDGGEGAEESGGNEGDEKSAAPKMKAGGRSADPVQAEEEAKQRERELFNVRLDDQLAPRSDGCLKEASTAHLQKLVKLRMTLSEILTDFDSWPLSRDDRESLVDLRRETDENIADSREKQERGKQLACAHALAAYDAIRLYTDGVGTVGAGTKDVSFHAHATGVDIMKFLPKGQGEASVPKAEKEAKIQRAAARKSAALAAIERERLRRDGNSEENAERRAAKAAEVAKKRIEEENLLFSDAQEGLLASRFGGKTPAEVAVVARMWEKLASTCQQRYPSTFKAFIHSNNCACAIAELYGPDHFKAKEAIRQLDNAKDFVLADLESYSNLTFPKSKDPIGKAKLEARLMEEEALRKIFVDVGPPLDGATKVQKEKLDSDDSDREEEEEEDDEDGGGEGKGSAREGSRRSSRARGEEEARREGVDEVLKIPEDLLVHVFCILQNYLALLRDAGNSYLLGKSDRVRKLVAGICKRLDTTDRDSILERAAPPDYGECNVLLMPSFPEQTSKTIEEVQELYDALVENEDSDSDSDGDYDDAEEGDTITAGGGSTTSSLTHQSLPDSKRFKRRSSVAKFDPSMLAGGVENLGEAAREAAEAARRAEEREEAAIRAEREAKRLKYERQRRLDGILRKKIVKQRMKLYHLIDSGKINRVFDMKAGHVLSDNAKINWGHHDDDEGDPTQFLEDSTQPTDTDSDTNSISSKGTSIASDAKRKKKKKKKKKKEQEAEEAEMMAAKDKEKDGVDAEAAQNARLAERNSRKSTLFSMFSSGSLN